MIFSIRIDGIQRPPVTVEELGALIERGEFKPGDSLIGPGLPQWTTGAEAGAYLRPIFRQRLPREFGPFAAPPHRSTPSAPPGPSGCALALKIVLGMMAIAGALLLALLLLLYGLCGGFR